jgi:hypothetical protein
MLRRFACLLFVLVVPLSGCGGTTSPTGVPLVDGSTSDAPSGDAPATPDAPTVTDSSAADGPPTDSADAPATPDAPTVTDGQTADATIDPGPYCTAQSAFVAQCDGDASASCVSQLAAACASIATNLSAATRDAVVGCSGHFVCGSDLFDANGCVDAALANATLTSLQQTMLTDLCATCNTPATTCTSHSEINGPHRFGAGVVYASDAILRATGAACIAQGQGQADPLNCENAAYNCLQSATFSALPNCQ